MRKLERVCTSFGRGERQVRTFVGRNEFFWFFKFFGFL